MRWGICGDATVAEAAAAAGFDYWEKAVGELLRPREPREAFLAELARLRDAPLPCEVVFCFIPGDLKITGPQADMAALRTYVQIACERAAEAGVKVIVFGSGQAREVTEGFGREHAWRQLVEFCRMAGPVAASNGLTIAVEPLHRGQCNIINTVAEGAALVREADAEGIRLLVDCYHWACEEEPVSSIVQAGSLLAHAHLATGANRLLPGEEPYDFAPFFQGLRQAGYSGRVSFEGAIRDPKDLPAGLSILRAAAAG